MHLITLLEPGRLQRIQVPDPVPNDNEIRVRVGCVGICGSDIEVFKGYRQAEDLAGRLVVGHEACGIIDMLGKKVQGLRCGDRVSFVGHWGSCADYAIVNPESVLRFPERISLRDGCLIEVLPGVMMAATRSSIDRSKDVLVIGQGLSGLLLTRLIHLHGCRRLVVVDPHEHRLELAREFGATATCFGRVCSEQNMLSHERGMGFDVCVIAAPGESCIEHVEPFMRSRGRIVYYGGLAENAQLNLFQLHRRSITLIKESECINGTLEARRLWHESLQLICDGVLPLWRLRTHVFPMGEAQQAFEARLDPKQLPLHVVLENDWVDSEEAGRSV